MTQTHLTEEQLRAEAALANDRLAAMKSELAQIERRRSLQEQVRRDAEALFEEDERRRREAEEAARLARIEAEREARELAAQEQQRRDREAAERAERARRVDLAKRLAPLAALLPKHDGAPSPFEDVDVLESIEQAWNEGAGDERRRVLLVDVSSQSGAGLLVKAVRTLATPPTDKSAHAPYRAAGEPVAGLEQIDLDIELITTWALPVELAREVFDLFHPTRSGAVLEALAKREATERDDGKLLVIVNDNCAHLVQRPKFAAPAAPA